MKDKYRYRQIERARNFFWNNIMTFNDDDGWKKPGY